MSSGSATPTSPASRSQAASPTSPAPSAARPGAGTCRSPTTRRWSRAYSWREAAAEPAPLAVGRRASPAGYWRAMSQENVARARESYGALQRAIESGEFEAYFDEFLDPQ